MFSEAVCREIDVSEIKIWPKRSEIFRQMSGNQIENMDLARSIECEML